MKKLLKTLTKLADQLDVRGFTKEADIIDQLVKKAIEEWQYHGYTSPEDYERVKKMRRPELYEKPKEEIKKIKIEPENKKYIQKDDILVPIDIRNVLWLYSTYGVSEKADRIDIDNLDLAILRGKRNWSVMTDDERKIIINALKWFDAHPEEKDLDEDWNNIDKFIDKLSRIGVKV